MSLLIIIFILLVITFIVLAKAMYNYGKTTGKIEGYKRAEELYTTLVKDLC
jgi:hypothetical protein